MRGKNLSAVLALAAMMGSIAAVAEPEYKLLGFDEMREPTRRQDKLAAAQRKRDRKNARRLLKKQRGEAQ